MSDQIDVNYIADVLNNKMDLPIGVGQDAIDYIVETKKPTANDPTWYRVYKSGWVEQGGVINTTSTTYPKEMADTNYCLQCTPHHNQNAQVYWSDFGYNKTTTGFSIRIGNNTDYYVCGMGA